jgi:magnesium transporter
VASVYGMNFKWMPELSQPWGYPFAMAFMLLSAFLPYRYFKKKKWL